MSSAADDAAHPAGPVLSDRVRRIVLLVGGKRPLRLDRSAFDGRLRDPTTREALAAVGIGSFDALLALAWAGPGEIRQYAGPGPILTDDRPMVEYYLSLPRRESLRNVEQVRGDVRRYVE